MSGAENEKPNVGPPPVPEPLPAGVKLIGWLGVLGGAWNLLIGAGMLLLGAKAPSDSVAGHPGVRAFMAVAALIGGMCAISCIGLLLRKNWGRRGVLLALGLIFLAALGWGAFNSYNRLGASGDVLATLLLMVVGAVLGLGTIGLLLFLCFRYLTSSRIRELYRA
ncbi:MAG: hypothetical protein R6V58_16555 [Planctomycetota bacterium]